MKLIFFSIKFELSSFCFRLFSWPSCLSGNFLVLSAIYFVFVICNIKNLDFFSFRGFSFFLHLKGLYPKLFWFMFYWLSLFFASH